MKEEKSITTAQEPKWIAVYSISLAGLITSEFISASNLTPIARENKGT